jgi:hypothetical protein
MYNGDDDDDTIGGGGPKWGESGNTESGAYSSASARARLAPKPVGPNCSS